jgi:uncharacterized membrane protein
MVRKVLKKSKKDKVKHNVQHSVKAVSKGRKKSDINEKLNKILAVEGKLLREEEKVEGEERRVETEEKKIETEDQDINKIEEEMKKEESDIEKLEKIEEEIKSEVGEHPLAKVTLKDITKGLIGAFIGLVIHYTFTYGVEIAKNITMARATLLFPIAFLVGLLFIYATGFRKIEDKKLLLYMPLRVGMLFMCSLVMSILVLFLFYPEFGHNFQESYKMVAGVMLAAIVGACTADLLGKE